MSDLSHLGQTARSGSDVPFAALLPNDGDIAVLVRAHGRACAAWIRHGEQIIEMPAKWESRYDVGVKDPGTGLQIGLSAHVGWTRKQWKEANDATE